MKDKFEKILHEHNIDVNDPSEVIDCVQELFEYMADELRKTEPYAITQIDIYETVAAELFELSSSLY